MIGLRGDSLEYRTHFRWAVIVVAVLFFILLARFFYLQVVQGERYESLATVSHVVRVRLPPTRGTIRDRNGEVLAADVEVSDLMVVPRFVKDPEREVALLQALRILDEEEGANLLAMIRRYRRTSRGFHVMAAHTNLVGDRCPIDLTRMTFDPQRGKLVCTRCGAAYSDQRAVVQSHLHELPGFSLRSRSVRHYPPRELTAHVVGFVNEVTRREVDGSGGRFRPGDQIGRSGIERAMDSTLRGKMGEDVFVRSASGDRIAPARLPPPFKDIRSTAPRRGRDVRLALDVGLQKVARDAMSRYRSGAVVAMDVDNGDVLVMYSHPSFDPEPGILVPRDAGRRKADPILSPRMNKAVTAYPPGSVFKAFTAVAGLVEGVITKDTAIDCPGFYVFKRHRFKCHKRSGHGELSLVPAIAMSCDVFFYVVAEHLGIDKLAGFAGGWFGLGRRTGVEVPESRGLVPTRAWYDERGRKWMPGFTLNTSVGQGDVRATPLQVARAYAALVNGGRLLRPRLVLEMADPDTGATRSVPVEVQRRLDLPGEVVGPILDGLYDAVNTEDGTAYGVHLPELPFGGKTGTAQAPERRKGASEEIASWLRQDHAWFVGFAPWARPRIVVAVMVEHGGTGGKVAAPIARKVIEAYYSEHADEFAGLWKGFDKGPVLEVMEDPGTEGP